VPTNGLFGAELVAIDGSKFKAVNSSSRYYTQKKLNHLIQIVETRIQEHLQHMDQQDARTEAAPARPTAEQLKQKLDQLRQRKDQYDQWLKELKKPKPMPFP